MNIKIISVGKIKESFYRDAVSEYIKRLSRYCKTSVVEVDDEKTPDNASDHQVELILDKEGERIAKYIGEDDHVIALAIEGEMFDSVSFAKNIDRLGISGKSNIVFVIGGSLGLSEGIKRRADRLLSFSKMTFPHQLMRVILLEQIYRAYRIINNEPYHK
ncbi:MAG: 23S rRNA (pseudouridine(1915)-N(3))-methyltransferase RlmH [Lachnospiraceae bacterium]|nr:23S rRNA (pseudouridine(1915)-N(3))-methyltransferase RlmH [Lachnospiraceae bacterium]